MDTSKFTRKSFDVEAVQVTAENINDVAAWCDGTVEAPHALSVDSEPYIKVRVLYPINPRQTQAFVGDWVLYSGKGYKVYTDSAFKKHFVSTNPTAEEISDQAIEDLRNVFKSNNVPTEDLLSNPVSNKDAIQGKQ